MLHIYARLPKHTQASDFSGANVKRMTRAVLVGVVGSAAMLAGTQVGNGAVPTYNTDNSGDLVDLQLAEGPFDDATASLRIMQTTEDGTNFKLRVEGIHTSAEGIKFGAHLHVGACTEGVPVGTSAGGHYNDQVFPAGTLTYAAAVKSPKTEVWFDLVSDANGITADSTLVPFVPVDDDGIMSIVIHDLPHTDPNTGVAGTRAACLPVKVPATWIYQAPATI
jgi:Cu/Zn superoxide dismutase